MDAFNNALAASNASFSRRESAIQGINEAGIENFNLHKARQDANYNSAVANVKAGNASASMQEGITEGFSTLGYEPLLKAGVDYGAKSLYAAGKAAKAARLGTRAEAMAEGGADEGENAGRGLVEQASDAMDTELAQNVASALKAPGQLVSKAGDAIGQGIKSAGQAVYRGGQRAVQAVRGRVQQQVDQAQSRAGGQSEPEPEARGQSGAGEEDPENVEFSEATADDFDELPSGLGDSAQVSSVRTTFSTQGGKFTGTGDTAPGQQLSGASSEQQGALDLNRAQEAGEDLPKGAQGISEGGELDQLAPMRQAAGLQRNLASAGKSAQAESETLVNTSGQEVGSASTGGAGEAGASGASSAATGAGEAGAEGGAEAGASAAADAATAATEAGIDAAAASAEAVPGVGTVVGGLLAIGGAIFGGIEGAKHHSSAPKKPPPPPKPNQMGVNISEAAPVMDSSIYRSTGYNSLA